MTSSATSASRPRRRSRPPSTGTLVLWLLNHAYLAAQLDRRCPASLIFLYHRSRPLYERLRNTILATWLISVPVYASSPSRRRGSPTSGSSTRSERRPASRMDSTLTTRFYNELAAVPSLHVGFAVAVGIALAAAVRNPVAQGSRAAVGPGDRRSPSSPPATTTCSTSSPAWSPAAGYVVGAAGGAASRGRSVPAAAPRRCGPAFAEALDRLQAGGRRPSARAPPAIAQADRKREHGPDDGEHGARADEERRQPARGNRAAGHRAKVAASIATPAPTDAGAKGTSRAAALGEGHEQHGRPAHRQAEGRQEARERASRQARLPAARAARRARRSPAPQRGAAARRPGRRGGPLHARGRVAHGEAADQQRGDDASSAAGRRAPSAGPTPIATARARSTAPAASSPAPSATSVPASSGHPPSGMRRRSSSTRTASPPRAETSLPRRRPRPTRRSRRAGAPAAPRGRRRATIE